jgi:rod shape determining protein RodA
MKIRRLDWPLLLTALALSGFGLYSLSTLAAPSNLSSVSVTQAHVVKQAIFFTVSLGVAGLLLLPGYQLTRRLAYLAYGGCAIALVGLLLFGPYTRGARGWIPLGPISLQPAEFMKLAFVFALARWLSFAKELDSWGSLLPALLLAAIPTALVFVQPDLGNAMLFFPVLLAMLFVGGAPRRKIAALIIVAMIAVPVTYKFGMKEYQRNRLTGFLKSDKDLSYQQSQSMMAVKSGGLTGRDLPEGINHSFHIPDRHTDFVYSIVAEELGFLGSSAILLLFGTFFLQAGRIAHRTREPYGRLVVVGLTAFCGLQVFINVGMNIGVAPITGLTLPFVSYGGSSLLTCFLSLAVILNIGLRWVPTFSSRDLDSGHVSIRAFKPPPFYWFRLGAR